MKYYVIFILIIIGIFFYSEKKDQEENEVIYEQGYIAGQKDAIEEIRKEADGWEQYVDYEQLQDVLSEELGDDMRDAIMSYVVIYDKSVIVEEVIIDSGYE